MQLTTASPMEIDTELARLGGVQDGLNTQRGYAANAAHSLNGERAVYKGRRRVYTTPLDDTLNELALKLADEKIVLHEVQAVREIIERVADLDKQLDAVQAEIQLIDIEYARRPWSRFIAVENGHLHSGERCVGGTIRVTTTIGWHPELSGKTEADAVAELGPLLCTHCFPTAPVEWTVGKPKTDRCAGSGAAPVDGKVYTQGMSRWGRCPECKVGHNLTQYGVLRAHKPAK